MSFRRSSAVADFACCMTPCRRAEGTYTDHAFSFAYTPQPICVRERVVGPRTIMRRLRARQATPTRLAAPTMR